MADFESFRLNLSTNHPGIFNDPSLNPSKSGTFSPSPRQKPPQSAIRLVAPFENLCFSTFFSTVVENFGG
jgi:hypothetical protein